MGVTNQIVSPGIGVPRMYTKICMTYETREILKLFLKHNI